MASCCGHFHLFSSHSHHLWRLFCIWSKQENGAFLTWFLSPETALYYIAMQSPMLGPRLLSLQRRPGSPLLQSWVNSGIPLWKMDMCKKCNFRKEDSISISRPLSNQAIVALSLRVGTGWARTCPLSPALLLSGTVSRWRKATGTGLDPRSWSNDIWRRETLLSNATVSVSVTADIVTMCGCVPAPSVCHMDHS